MNNQFKKITLAYGDWEQRHQIKYKFPTPGNGLRNKLNKYLDIFMIDEHRTSKLCYKCHFINKHFKTKEPNLRLGKEGQIFTVNDLIRCTNKSCSTSWNRDRNASLNILMLANKILEGKERPQRFVRGYQIPMVGC